MRRTRRQFIKTAAKAGGVAAALTLAPVNVNMPSPAAPWRYSEPVPRA